MSQGSLEVSDHVTVVVFKDNYAARTFQVPLYWIARLGAVLGILIGLLIVSGIFAVKYYRVALKADLSRVQDLEQEVVDLRAALKTSEAKPNLAMSTSLHSQVSTKGDIPFFTNFAPTIPTRLADPSTLPLSIQPPKVSWRGPQNLRVRFALQYTNADQGSQEGRILILARGPETLLTYPAGTLGQSDSEHLLLPENGETFAVSRFREVKADFGPIRSQDALTEIEIYIFNRQGQVLIYQKIPIEKTIPTPEKTQEALPEISEDTQSQ